MKKSLIKTYPSINFVQIGKYFVRKNEIESIDDTVPGKIEIRTTSGMIFSKEGKEAKEILSDIGFNQK